MVHSSTECTRKDVGEELVTHPRPVITPATSDRTEVDDYRDRLQADLKIAERVHRSMIPANERRGNLEIVCDFQPMISVGGDYASVHFQNDQNRSPCPDF